MSGAPVVATDHAGKFRDRATEGDTLAAVAIALGLLDAGVPAELIISEVLAPSQREVGECWSDNRLSIADEHLATGVTEATLHALGRAAGPPTRDQFVAVACAEGDWHGIAALMFSEQLRAQGVKVAYLGASMPADHVASFIKQHRPDVLAISCNLPLFYRGVTALANVAHSLDTPVIAGGRALDARRSERLGADGWARDIVTAMTLVDHWRREAPAPHYRPLVLDPRAEALDGRAADYAVDAMADLHRRHPAMTARLAVTQLTRTQEDLAYTIRFIAAAQLVDDDSVFTDFLEWLDHLLRARGVPTSALVAGLEALASVLAEAPGDVRRLIDVGLARVAPSLSQGPTESRTSDRTNCA